MKIFFAIFILHSRESKLCRYVSDGLPAVAISEVSGPAVFHVKVGASR